jgi:hypothetical protein
VTVEVLPGRGVALPWPGRRLTFGMTRDEVGRAFAGRADLAATFVCGSTWAAEARLGDLVVVVFAEQSDSLAGLSVRFGHRHSGPGPNPGPGPVHVPVGLDDIDLLGWPVAEVMDALCQAGRDVRSFDGYAWIDGRTLRLNWRQPACADEVHLYPAQS